MTEISNRSPWLDRDKGVSGYKDFEIIIEYF